MTLHRATGFWNRSIYAAFRYSSFTAADEKIPLSMVRVNTKPQHLVFCSHFGHQFPKPRHLPVESSEQHCGVRPCALKSALKTLEKSDPFSPGLPT
jgi:hypothetical protein